MSNLFGYTNAPVSDMQMRALEYLIIYSQDGDTFAKQLAIWLLRKSNNLSRHCYVHIGPSFHELAKVAGKGFHDMMSSNGTTHLNELFCLTNSLVGFSYHVGDALHGGLGGFSFWIHSCTNTSFRGVMEVAFDVEAVLAIAIKR